jgi:hypothetical protein
LEPDDLPTSKIKQPLNLILSFEVDFGTSIELGK